MIVEVKASNHAKAVSSFSGFHSVVWGRLDRPPADPVAASADAAAAAYHRVFSGLAEPDDCVRALSARMLKSAPLLIDRYEALVADVPKQYRLVLPKRGGEIGIIHRGRLINPDLLLYQSRMNALFGAGVLQRLEAVIARSGRARYAEIGPGSAQFAFMLRQCLDERLDVVLIDLPLAMANGCAYLSCAAGPAAVVVGSPDALAPPDCPFVYLANYLLPAYARQLAPFDLVHNANSLHEMSAPQVDYYLSFVEAHLADDGCLHLAGMGRTLDYHQDVPRAAASRFPNHRIYNDRRIGVAPIIEPPHMLCYPSSVASS